MSLDIKWSNEPGELPPTTVEKGGPLKEVIIAYVGEKLNPENDEVTVPMIINVIADEFPELALSLAEENWLRGYEQGVQDVEAFEE